jgi:hypothetical protein
MAPRSCGWLCGAAFRTRRVCSATMPVTCTDLSGRRGGQRINAPFPRESLMRLSLRLLLPRRRRSFWPGGRRPLFVIARRISIGGCALRRRCLIAIGRCAQRSPVIGWRLSSIGVRVCSLRRWRRTIGRCARR